MGQNQRAIQMFTIALRSDPTYIRAYICRAQAYHRANELQRALRDLTSAIHMKPDMQYVYIMRGQYLCDMKHFGLATFCIQHAAEMNKALGSSLIQQAAVQSFLGNKMKAITCLVAANDTCPSLLYLLLLGKTQMKAQKFTDAMNSFRKALTLLCLNKASSVVSGQASSDPQASEILYLTGLCYVAQAQLMQQDKDLFLLALDAFNSALKLNHNYADAYHQCGICRMHLQQPKSLQDFNHALSLQPAHFQAYLSRAAHFEAEGRYAKAILNCNEAIKIQPYSVRAYLYRGVFKFRMKGFKGGVQDLTMVINIDRTCSFAFYNRGVCYQQLKEYELALRDYSTVLLLASRKEIALKVLLNRGLLYLELNDYDNALQDFKAASGKSPGDATIFHALGVLHHRLGQLQESTEAYTQALRLKPFFLDAYLGRGCAFMNYGHAQAYKQAQRDFLSALHLNPLCSSARINLGYNFQVLGSFQKAWNQFTVAVDIQPESWVALDGRAVISLQMGHTYAAFQDMSNALRQNPTSHQLYTNRGVVNEIMGDNVNAMKDYQKAISLNPKFSLAYFNAANLYFHNRQFSKACKFYNQASELDPGDESVLLNRAITHALLRQVPEALRDFSDVLRLNPLSSHIYFNRANLYCSLKKHHSAERELTEALLFQPNDALLYKLRADVRGHLGLTELAITDYKMALQLKEAQGS
ncbi:tetratricopeptide repeat protein 6 isoform X1 [Conger conger]|uniref:tetratricopeptide repeat protein 6 isoform X1 n=1 Tax=Conger conger TaxID=82655 RepID=UPI002A5AB818|nr:tetratricopeptide repeat protein 6 isoform X1 [Conger conger]